MVGKVKRRRRGRADWELLTRLYEAGTTAVEIARRTGYSERWVRNRIRLCRDDPEAARCSDSREGDLPAWLDE